MKYAYDKGFKKAAVNLPFGGLVCKLSHKPLEKILERVKIPTDVAVRDFSIEGYRNEQIWVKEIVPENPSNVAILVLLDVQLNVPALLFATETVTLLPADTVPLDEPRVNVICFVIA